MKKILFCFILLFCFCLNIEAKKLEVTLNKCVDGDTAWFNVEDEPIKTRFLAIDTPESTNKIEKYGKEASEFTCNILKNAKKIEIEYDPNSDKLDKYDRHLVWVFVDGELLQNIIIQNGLAEVEYIYGDYLYTHILENSEEEAKLNKVGIWENNETKDYTFITIVVSIIIIICLFSSTIGNEIVEKTKSKLKKNIKKEIKKILK